MREASDVDLFRQLALWSGHISVFDRFFGLHLGLFEGVTWLVQDWSADLAGGRRKECANWNGLFRGKRWRLLLLNHGSPNIGILILTILDLVVNLTKDPSVFADHHAWRTEWHLSIESFLWVGISHRLNLGLDNMMRLEKILLLHEESMLLMLAIGEMLGVLVLLDRWLLLFNCLVFQDALGLRLLFLLVLT